MKNTYVALFLLVVLLMLLSACEKGGEFRVYNTCSYPAYASVNRGELVTIPASGNHLFKIDTDRQTIFTGDVKRTVPVTLYGETYSLFDDYENIYTDSTTIEVSAGRTLEAYLTPNKACVKVTNNSSYVIPEAEIWQLVNLNNVKVGTFSDIQPGTSRFLRVAYSVPNAQVYYKVIITGIEYQYVSGFLQKDEQFLVMVEDQE
ncbi:MAG: hypothetical protein PHO32_04465 [Candidatus Cloacimonetes bacterium]|nr:hypothetical protein [Candidatus Cloacimonadota bacterium]